MGGGFGDSEAGGGKAGVVENVSGDLNKESLPALLWQGIFFPSKV